MLLLWVPEVGEEVTAGEVEGRAAPLRGAIPAGRARRDRSACATL